ncbi:MAG TPA: hypothetical protein VFK68_03305, partial [Propionibacteriaceae bacterium]|nr:hypothetical protein [Propionibacteriaceae bacterium]
MTNQPDESHPMRERVDKAISWFTQTDEPDAVDETDEQGAVAEPAGHTPETAASREPLTPAGEPTTSRDTETAASREPVTPAGEPIGSRDVAAEQAARADEQVSQTGPLTSEERAAETDRDVARSEDRIPEPEEALARQDERTSGAAPAAAGGALVGGTAAAGAVAEHERRREAERDVEREREADQAPVGEAPAERTGEAAVDEDTHVRRHEPPASWAEVHPNARQVPPEGAIDSEAETTGSQRSLYRDEAPTVAMPAAAAAGAAAGAATAGHGEPTAVMDATEFARLRREERAARDRQLGKVIAQDDADEPVP